MKNANFEKTCIGRGYGYDEYKVTNTEGMTKEEILDACDRNNWGGMIIGDYVKVYTD